MSKKDFKNHIEDLFRNDDDDNNQQSNKSDNQLNTNINLDDITDEKVKWLIIKLSRYEKELRLWRTGKLTPKIFEETLKKHNLRYDDKSNQITKIE